MAKNKELIPAKELEENKNKAESLMEKMSEVEIKDKSELGDVANKIKEVKDLKTKIEFERDKYINPAKEIIENAKEKYAPYIKICVDAEILLKKKAEEFMLAEKKREDEQRAKEIAKVESGYQKPETAVEKITKIQKAEKSVDTGSTRLSMKMVKDIEIVDESKIPDEYYKPRELDMKKIRSAAITVGIEIPGVKVFEKPQMASR